MKNKKFKRNFNKDINSLVNKLNTQSREKSWPFIAPHWLLVLLQLLTLILVAYGYVTTIKPVYQKEKLLEENAQLSLSKSNIQREVKALANKLDELKVENKELLRQKDEISKKLIHISEMRNDAESALVQRVNDLREAEKQLLLAEDELYAVEKQSLYWFETPVPGEVIDTLSPKVATSEYHLSTLERIKLKMENAEGVKKSALEKLYKEYQKGLETRAHLIKCPSINQVKWIEREKEAIKYISSELPNCSAPVVNAQGDIIQVGTECYRAVKYHVGVFMRSEYRDIQKPCYERQIKLNSIILGDTEPSDLPAFKNTAPPTLRLIKEVVLPKL